MNRPQSGIVLISVMASITAVSCLAAIVLYLNLGPSASDLAAGKALFEHEFSENDPLCGNGDGLGPVFNERSCVACHFQGGTGGAGPNSKNVTAFEAFPVPGRPETVASGVHTFATATHFEESSDLLTSMFPSVPGAVRVTDGCSTQFQDFDPVQIHEINTPPLFGLAEIEKISTAALTLNSTKRSFSKIGRELEGDFGGTGVGRLRSLGSRGIGKFGWKGQFSTIKEFVANACAMELGLTNHIAAQSAPRQFKPDESAEHDMTKQQLYELVSFVKSLPRPQQVIPSNSRHAAIVGHGQELFLSIGCADCHVPDIGGVEGIYSDFLLYEVEDEKNADDYVEPEFSPEFTLPFDHPRPNEWQTPPLWGVADSGPYFHDGKSPNLVAAILRHGRDGAYAREQFKDLADEDKRAVVAFLMTLRAPSVE